MVMLPVMQASEPSPKLIIAATSTHGIHGGPGIAMLLLSVIPGPSDGPIGYMGPGENGQIQIWVVSVQYEW